MNTRNKTSHRAQAQDWADSGLDISSLIDVSFLLIIYFLVATSLQPREVEVGLALPGHPVEPASEWRAMQVSLQEDGSVLVGGADNLSSLGKMAGDGSWRELTDRLATYHQASVAVGEKAVVQLESADEAPHASLVGLLNATHSAGIDEILLVK